MCRKEAEEEEEDENRKKRVQNGEKVRVTQPGFGRMGRVWCLSVWWSGTRRFRHTNAWKMEEKGERGKGKGERGRELRRERGRERGRERESECVSEWNEGAVQSPDCALEGVFLDVQTEDLCW